jgi:hypothetical protein
MNIIPGVLTAVGTVKIPTYAQGWRTGPGPAGAPGIGSSGHAIALSDGRTPGKTPLSEEYLPVFPTIVDEFSKIGANLDKSV